MTDFQVKGLNMQGSNRFRFQSFAERVAAVDIDVVHKIRDVHELEENPEEVKCFFLYCDFDGFSFICTTQKNL